MMSAAVIGALLLAASGCRKPAPVGAAAVALRVTSPDIQEGAVIPKQFTCDGAGVSPALAWEQPPAKTASLAVIVRDPDAPSGTFIHWVIYNLPPAARGLPQGVAAKEQLADGSRQGVNSDDEAGYYAPCPPGSAPHRYFFSVYALDQMLPLPEGADEKQVTKAMQGHVLAEGKLMGRYGR